MNAYWLEEAKSTLIHKNMVKHIKPQKLTHVSSVKVCAPPDRDNDHPLCRIYGEVSFQVGRSFTTLFRRGENKPDVIDLKDDDESYLTFSDHDEPPPALPPVSPTTPLHVKMNLTEITSSGEHVSIAKIDYPWEPDCEDASGMELGKCFVLEGLNGFKFEVCYSVMFGARVEVGATIVVPGEGDSVMACQLIAYLYSLKDPKKKPTGEDLLRQTRALLTSVYFEDPMPVKVGKDIDFDRKFVVAPIREDQFLSIQVCIAMNCNDLIKTYDVDFPLMQLWNEDTQSLWADEWMLHVKNLWLPSGTKLAFGIKFFEEDVQPPVKHDIKSAPTSLERPRSLEYGDGGGSSNLTPKFALPPTKRSYSCVHEEHGDGGVN